MATAPKNLIDKEDVEVEGRKFFISSIPAVTAQKIFLTGYNVLAGGQFASLPPALMEDLLSYCGTYNEAGEEVQFLNEGLINMFVKDVYILLALEQLMVKKNFSFLFDGRAEALASQLNSTLPASK